MRHALAAVPLAISLLRASPAQACPLCDSATGTRVRAGIFDSSFGYNLLATLLPFPVLLGIIALIHFGPPGVKDRSGTRGRPEAGQESGSYQKPGESTWNEG
jgi:hypothetical protein